MTLKQKLFLLAGINILLTIVVGIVGYWGICRLDPSESPLTIQMSAVRNAMQIDMMHDAFRADALRSILIATTNDTRFGSREDIATELKDHAEVMNTALKVNKELPLSDSLKAEVEKVSAPIQKYQVGAKEIATLAFTNPKSAIEHYETFQALFEELEGILGTSADMLEKGSKDTFAQEVGSAKFLINVIVGVIVFAIAVGIVVSLLVVRSVIGPMKNALQDLNTTSAELFTQAEVMTQSSTDLNSASNEQSAAVQQSVAAIAEILSMVSQTSDFSQQSISASHSMTEKTQEGSRIIHRLSKSISSIQQANAQLMEMANIIQEISNKTTVINDIVFKTQLLSFNASIEAARAGQHGRGFAVVAEEVGNLAEMSGSSAREIQSLLEDSQKQVALIVDSVQKRVAEGEQVATEAVTIFEKISGETSQLNNYINRIGDATKEQETGIHQISTAMSQVGASAQKNLLSANQTSQTSRKLTGQSRGLSNVVKSLEGILFGGSSSGNSKYLRKNSGEQYIHLTDEYTETVSSSRSAKGHHRDLADDESFRPYVG